jgi:hypothetical protein
MMNQDFPGKNKVASFFGYWPLFCDAKLLELSFSRKTSPNLVCTFHYIDNDRNKYANIQLVFIGVKDFELSDFFFENVVDEIVIQKTSDSDEANFYVEIESAYGLRGHIECVSIEARMLDE